jgi:hypothetical protein
MSYLQLPPNIELDVRKLAKERHISHDDAILMLIRTGLDHTLVPPEVGKHPVERHRHLKRGPQPPLRTDHPEKIIGLFADSPETVDAILKEVEARSDRYADEA